MRRTKRWGHIAVAILLMTGFSSPAAMAGELTLNEALARMEMANDTLAAARQAKSVAEYEKDAAFGLHFPTVEASARWTRIDDPIAIGIQLLPGLPEFTMKVQDDTFVKGRLTASMPLYAGGRIQAANQAASSRVSEAGARLQETDSRLMREMVSRYYGLRFARKVVAVRRAYFHGMERHLVEAKQLEASGMIAYSERLHAEVAWSEADRVLKRSVRDAAIADTALANLLAVDEGDREETIPVSPLFLSREIEPLAHFTSAALHLSPLLRRIQEKGVQAEAGVKAEAGTLLPKVYLFATRQMLTEDLTLLEPEWAAGVGVKVPLFEGFSSLNRLRAARARMVQIGHLSSQARKDIVTLTEKLYHEVVAQVEQYDALKTSRALAEEAVRVQTRAFEEGYATSLDVVDARLTQAGVEIKQLKAVYDYDVALARLLETSGLPMEFHTYRNDKEQEVTF